MSIPRKKSIACPKCHATIHFTMWESINTEMSFAVDEIISGKLFEVTCGNCGKITRIDYPMLFNDMEHGIMIMYQRQKDNMDNSKLDSLWKAFKTNHRIVFSQVSLREKVSIINAGFDDRVMELYKFIVLNTEFAEQHPDEIGTAYFLVKGNKHYIEIHTEKGESYFTLFNKEAYDIIEEHFKQCQKVHVVDEAVIDVEWAEEYVKDILMPFEESLD